MTARAVAAQPRIVQQEPEQGVGVEQHPHCMYSWKSLRCSSSSWRMISFPLPLPGVLGLRGAAPCPTSLATGPLTVRDHHLLAGGELVDKLREPGLRLFDRDRHHVASFHGKGRPWIIPPPGLPGSVEQPRTEVGGAGLAGPGEAKLPGSTPRSGERSKLGERSDEQDQVLTRDAVSSHRLFPFSLMR